MITDEVAKLKSELKVARNEIHNLRFGVPSVHYLHFVFFFQYYCFYHRKQISTLGNKQRKDVLQIKQTLDRYCKSPNAELVELKKNVGSTKIKVRVNLNYYEVD